MQKVQNKNRDLISSVKKIQQYGFEVQGGFIVGFDNDKPNIFNRMVSFIQESGIVTAMVGLLNAPKGTDLYKRLQSEGRLTDEFSGDNTDFTMNFTPKMDRKELVSGYESIISTIYSPKNYYDRDLNFLKSYHPKRPAKHDINPGNIIAFLKSIFRLGFFGKERRYYWKLLTWSFIRRPEVFPMAVRFSIYGFHFRKIYEGISDHAAVI